MALSLQDVLEYRATEKKAVARLLEQLDLTYEEARAAFFRLTGKSLPGNPVEQEKFSKARAKHYDDLRADETAANDKRKAEAEWRVKAENALVAGGHTREQAHRQAGTLRYDVHRKSLLGGGMGDRDAGELRTLYETTVDRLREAQTCRDTGGVECLTTAQIVAQQSSGSDAGANQVVQDAGGAFTASNEYAELFWKWKQAGGQPLTDHGKSGFPAAGEALYQFTKGTKYQRDVSANASLNESLETNWDETWDAAHPHLSTWERVKDGVAKYVPIIGALAVHLGNAIDHQETWAEAGAGIGDDAFATLGFEGAFTNAKAAWEGTELGGVKWLAAGFSLLHTFTGNKGMNQFKDALDYTGIAPKINAWVAKGSPAEVHAKTVFMTYMTNPLQMPMDLLGDFLTGGGMLANDESGSKAARQYAEVLKSLGMRGTADTAASEFDLGENIHAFVDAIVMGEGIKASGGSVKALRANVKAAYSSTFGVPMEAPTYAAPEFAGKTRAGLVEERGALAEEIAAIDQTGAAVPGELLNQLYELDHEIGGRPQFTAEETGFDAEGLTADQALAQALEQDATGLAAEEGFEADAEALMAEGPQSAEVGKVTGVTEVFKNEQFGNEIVSKPATTKTGNVWDRVRAIEEGQTGAVAPDSTVFENTGVVDEAYLQQMTKEVAGVVDEAGLESMMDEAGAEMTADAEAAGVLDKVTNEMGGEMDAAASGERLAGAQATELAEFLEQRSGAYDRQPGGKSADTTQQTTNTMGDVALEEWAQLPQMISNLSYKPEALRAQFAERMGLRYNKVLSTPHRAVFTDTSTGQVHVGYRGTADFTDVGTDLRFGVNNLDTRFTQELEAYNTLIKPYLEATGYTATMQGHSLGGAVTSYMNYQLRADALVTHATSFNAATSSVGNLMTDLFTEGYTAGPPLNAAGEPAFNYIDRMRNVVQKGDAVSADVNVAKAQPYGDTWTYDNVQERGMLGSHSLNTFSNPIWFEEWNSGYKPLVQVADTVLEGFRQGATEFVQKQVEAVQRAVRRGGNFQEPTDASLNNWLKNESGLDLSCYIRDGQKYCHVAAPGAEYFNKLAGAEEASVEELQGVQPKGTVTYPTGPSGTQYVCEFNSPADCKPLDDIPYADKIPFGDIPVADFVEGDTMYGGDVARKEKVASGKTLGKTSGIPMAGKTFFDLDVLGFTNINFPEGIDNMFVLYNADTGVLSY